MSALKWNCFSCQGVLETEGLIGRKEECLHCRADMHVCRNCLHYDETSYNECKEPSAERVLEKEKSNFCDYFAPNVNGTNAAKISSNWPPCS